MYNNNIIFYIIPILSYMPCIALIHAFHLKMRTCVMYLRIPPDKHMHAVQVAEKYTKLTSKPG